jgi:chromosome segregation ATPase
MKKIKRVVIHNYRGVEELDLDVPAAGAIARGRNGAGKSTILKAIKAALLAQDVGPDAIRKGAAKSEILVDIDDLEVRRVITENGNRVSVSRGEFEVKRPQTYLTELLGTSSLDPMDLLLLRGKERRAAVLAALPVTVTVEQLRAWWPKCPDDYDCSGHGLEVIATVREMAYRRRAEKNKAVKEADTALSAAKKAAESISAPAEAPDLDRLENEAEAARAHVVSLQSRAAEAQKQIAGLASKRAKVDSLRTDAERVRSEARPVTPEEIERATDAVESTRAAVARLRAQLEAAELTLRDCERAAIHLHASAEEYDAAIERALGLEQQADELEETLESTAVRPVSATELESAEAAARAARERLDRGRLDVQVMRESKRAQEALAAAKASAIEARSDAGRLDAIVKALTDDAPAELLGQADGIDGLTLDGDEVLLDGVRLDALCGAEQIRFCVEVARRANSKSRILICDGLERLDPDALEVFVREATRGGYQLLATRVDRGDVVIEAIEAEHVEVERAVA